MRFAVILAAIDDRREEMRFALRKAEEIRIRDDISAVLPLPEIRNGNAGFLKPGRLSQQCPPLFWQISESELPRLRKQTAGKERDLLRVTHIDLESLGKALHSMASLLRLHSPPRNQSFCLKILNENPIPESAIGDRNLIESELLHRREENRGTWNNDANPLLIHARKRRALGGC